MPAHRRLTVIVSASVWAVLCLVAVCRSHAADPDLFGGTSSPAPASASTPAPVSGPPTLRALATALAAPDREEAGRLAWQLLAQMARAREAGGGPSEFLAAGYQAEKLSIAQRAIVQRNLLGAWNGAQTLALFTPENLALMDRGQSPRATRGARVGALIIFDTGNPPEMVLTPTIAGPGFDPARVTADVPAPLPTPAAPAAPAKPTKRPKSSFPALPYEIKTIEVRLGQRLPLDAYGMTNMDLRLDRVERDKYVQLLLEDRHGIHYATKDRYDLASERWVKDRFRADDAARSVYFEPETIPGTNIEAIRLATCGFATIYLDENLGAQVTYRILIRLRGEMLILDQLDANRRKLFEYKKFATYVPRATPPPMEAPPLPAK